MRALLLACSFLALSTGVLAQSAPPYTYGQVPTAGQWRAAFASKQDVLQFIPLNLAGGTMTGKLNTTPATINRAGFAILPGIAPTSPMNGDIWITSSGMFAQVSGQTQQISTQSNSVPNSRQIVAGAGLSGGGDLSADRTILLGQIASGAILANLTGTSAIPAASTLSAILDNAIGAARGTLAVRGAAGWSPLALGASGTTLQSNGTDVVYGAVSPGVGAVRYDTSQSLTTAQQVQARANINALGPHSLTIFTSSGTFTTSAATTSTSACEVTTIGAGGNGSVGSAGNVSGGGGGAGGTAIKRYTGFAASTGYTVTVGTNGSRTSSFAGPGTTISASGGSDAGGTVFGGAGGTGTNGDINLAGGYGTSGTAAGNYAPGGNGGASSQGGGGRGGVAFGSNTEAGYAGQAYGSGSGGGSATASVASGIVSQGAPGLVIVRCFQ